VNSLEPAVETHPDNEPERAPAFELVVYERRQRRQFRLPARGVVVIGRSPDCDIRLEDSSISRRHLLLNMGSFEAEETGSKNGSLLYSGQQGATWESVAEGTARDGVCMLSGRRYPLDSSSVLRLGNVVLSFGCGTPVVHTEPIRAAESLPLEDVVLEDPEMMRVYDLAARVAPTNLPVLVLGETGVGKDVLAEHIHHSSPRHKGPFVRVNCGALSDSLLESELFGHQRGAFTGAADAKAGFLELGHGGTVFLDEIGELPLHTQVKLLHVLETGEVTRVGATRARQIDVRYVAATNRELAQQVRLGHFRKDLYFRINAVCLKVTPLRKRKLEIEPLARYFLRRFCNTAGIPEPELTPAAIEHLKSYSWPGNIRELKNALERAPIMCGAGQILPRHLPVEKELTGSVRPDRYSNTGDWMDDDPMGTDAPSADNRRLSQARLAEALRSCAGNQTRAARLLGISRRTLVNRLNEYNLPRPRKRID
jgi:two-component system, NtrC family, response regulator AtoC